MPRKEKPIPRRTKRPNGSVPDTTITTTELMVLMHCSRRTLRRLTANEGFPEGWKIGKEVAYNREAAYAWLRKHKPGLIPEPVEPPKTDEDKYWDRLRARYLLDKEEEADNPPPPKPTRSSRRASAHK